MPRTSREDAAVVLDIEPVEFRSVELADHTATFATYRLDSDPAPLYRGLPDDRCQSPHWGYVFSGKIVFRYADHDETYAEGDAFYATPGHVPLCFAGTELLEFSPTELAAKTDEVIGKNMAAGVQPG